MTVLFDIRGADWPADDDGARVPPAEMFLNISNENARDFLDWMDLPHEDLFGEMPARQLAALLRRRLWPERRNRDDQGQEAFVSTGTRGALWISCGREPGKLVCYAERLLALADYGGDRTITWS